MSTTQSPDAPAVIARQVPPNASEIIDQRKQSQRWLNDNYYTEFQEVYRTAKARVEPIKVPTDGGEEKEDTTRTNICFPDHFVMIRHGKARLTRNAPNLRVRAQNQPNGDKAAALLMYQWDRSESQVAFSKIVHSAKMLGIGIGKSYYDKVQVTRRFRKHTQKLSAVEALQVQGAPDDEIAQAQAEEAEATDNQQPAPPASEAQVTAITAEYGNAVELGVPVNKFEGCVLASIFFGDWFPEPGFTSMNESAFHTENSVRDDIWLKYWMKQTTVDPDDDNGEEIPIIDPKAAEDLLHLAGTGRNTLDQRDLSLRRLMRQSVDLSDPQTYNDTLNTKRRKRFVIDERHSIENGRLVIEYVAEESIYLGKQWYPYDTYGRYLYNAMVLIPDLLGGIGDSTPRISKYLMQMRNNRGNQTNDFINNKLAPLALTREGANFTDKDLRRTSFLRTLKVTNPSDINVLQDPPFPGEAWQEQASIIREMQQIEPAMSDFAPGTDAIPQSGKLATTAVLQQKSADSVLADELNEMNFFVRSVNELHLTMNQQAMQEVLEIQKGEVDRVDAILQSTTGQPRTMRIDPMDLQEEMQVLPEAGSTLASDDDYKVKSLQQGLQLAMSMPEVGNVRYFFTELVKAMPGVNPEQAVLPPAPPPPPTPPKVNVGIAVKWAELATDVKTTVLGEVGLPTHDTQTLDLMHHVHDVTKKIGDMANVAADLQAPAHGNGAESPGGTDNESNVTLRSPAGLAGK